MAKDIEPTKGKEAEPQEPSTEIYGDVGGTMMPSIAAGLVYNPDTIPLRTYLQMEDDAQIKAVLTLIKAPLVKVVWSITCEDQDIARFCKMALDEVWGGLIRTVCNALNFGFQAYEKVWRKENDQWVYEDLMDLYPGSVTFKKGDRGQFNGIQQYTMRGMVDIPPEKSFIFTNEKRFGNPYGRSKLRSAYMYWYIDKFTYDFENVYFERYAMPIIHGEAPTGRTQTGSGAGQTEDNLRLLLDKLEALKQGSSITTPSDVDPISKQKKWAIKFLEAQRRGADFRSRHEYLDLMKARAIFAPELVFSAPYAGSSYALAREHASIFMSAEEAILQEVKFHIDKYLLRQLVSYNFGAKAPLATWDYESIAPETKTLLRDLVVSMVAGDIIRPDPDWIARVLGIKLREEVTKTKSREIQSKIQEQLLKQLSGKAKEVPPEEEIPPEEEVPPEEAIPEAVLPKPTLPARPGVTPTSPGALEALLKGVAAKPSRSAGAYKRWATTPTSQRYRSPRAWEKAFSKGLFAEIQNKYLFGSKKRRSWEFDEDLDDYVGVTRVSKLNKLRSTLAKFAYGIYRRLHV